MQILILIFCFLYDFIKGYLYLKYFIEKFLNCAIIKL